MGCSSWFINARSRLGAGSRSQRVVRSDPLSTGPEQSGTSTGPGASKEKERNDEPEQRGRLEQSNRTRSDGAGVNPAAALILVAVRRHETGSWAIGRH
jgi:hypothetical protein